MNILIKYKINHKKILKLCPDKCHFQLLKIIELMIVLIHLIVIIKLEVLTIK